MQVSHPTPNPADPKSTCATDSFVISKPPTRKVYRPVNDIFLAGDKRDKKFITQSL